MRGVERMSKAEEFKRDEYWLGKDKIVDKLYNEHSKGILKTKMNITIGWAMELCIEAVRKAREKIFEELERHENVTVNSKGKKPMQPALITLNRKNYFKIKKCFLEGKK